MSIPYHHQILKSIMHTIHDYNPLKKLPFKLSLWRYCLFDVGMFSSSQKALVVPDIIVYFILDDEHLHSLIPIRLTKGWFDSVLGRHLFVRLGLSVYYSQLTGQWAVDLAYILLLFMSVCILCSHLVSLLYSHSKGRRSNIGMQELINGEWGIQVRPSLSSKVAELFVIYNEYTASPLWAGNDLFPMPCRSC